ncbi:MAG TPA: hypothetical protein VE548_16290 [Nitrososphaeraceae archaeon]|jgi:hypothetical protein|nr:hypothetical protein [Nitrososphaeraceae archaeon]
MDHGIIDKLSNVKIGDKIRLIRVADHYMGIKSGEIGTVVDTSMSKVADLEGLRLVMWIKWESGKETAIVAGMDSFEVL